jgi:hypothetical protein
LSAVLASWERTSDLSEKDFQKPAIASQSRVFCFLTKPRKEKYMNQNKRFVPTEFGPETRFELRASAPTPFRVTQETEFERLKNQLLIRQLAEVPTPELIPPLRRAADEAAALAWVTQFPLLVFPVLFEEKTAGAVRQAERQARIYSRELVAA